MKIIKILLALLVLFIIGGLYWYFSIHKKLIKDKLQDTISAKTDSLYKLTYTGSAVDEVSGNAEFTNVKLKVDSTVLKKFIAENRAPDIIVDMEIASIKISGLESVGLLSEESVNAEAITIESPAISFYKIKKVTEKDVEVDTTEIYERLLGKFNFIKADSIHISNGSFAWNDNVQNKKICIKEFNCTIQNFLIDSVHRYKNIAAYFLKDATLHASGFSLSDSVTKKQFTISGIDYNAEGGRITIRDVQIAKGQSVQDIRISGLKTFEFFYDNKIKCKTLWLHNIDLSIKKLNNKTKPSDSLSISVPEIISSVEVDTLSISDGRFTLNNGDHKTIDISGIEANLYKAKIDSNGISLRDVIGDGLFKIFIRSVKITPEKGIHNVMLSNVRYLNSRQALSVENCSVTPSISTNNPAITGHTQQDLFTIYAKNLIADNFDPEKFMYQHFISAKSLSVSFDLKVLTDKFYGNNKESRIGMYPHQLLQKMKYKISIPKIYVHDSYVQYTEKEEKTGETGMLFFSQIKGEISNLSNITKDTMKVISDALFMNEAKSHSEWYFPMGAANGQFFVKGSMDNFNLITMNKLAKNLADAEIISGYLNHLAYTVNGNNTSSSGDVIFTYKDLKLKILAVKSDQLIKNPKLLSLLANAIIKNKSTDQRKHPYTNERDVTKSFFNLLWKSMLSGMKKAI